MVQRNALLTCLDARLDVVGLNETIVHVRLVADRLLCDFDVEHIPNHALV